MARTWTLARCQRRIAERVRLDARASDRAAHRVHVDGIAGDLRARQQRLTFVTETNTEKNKEITRRFFALLTDGDIEGAVALFADEGEFWQAGSDGPGRIISLAEVRDMFRSVIGTIPTGIVFTVGDTLAEGDWVVAQVSCKARLQNGNEYRNRYS